MLPLIILEELLGLFQRSEVIKLRCVNREFYGLAMQILFRCHVYQGLLNPEYLQFITRRGKSFKGLILKSLGGITRLQESGLALSQAFPSIRAISMGPVDWNSRTFNEELAAECLKLDKLVHLDIHAYNASLLECLVPVINTLGSLYVAWPTENLLSCLQQSPGLKKLLVPPHKLDALLLSLLQSDSRLKEIVLVPEGFGLTISSIPSNNGLSVWLEYKDIIRTCYAKISREKYFSNKRRIEELPLEVGLPDCFFRIKTLEAFTKLLAAPGLIDHCSLVKRASAGETQLNQDHLLKDIPSLYLDVKQNAAFMFGDLKFQASQLFLYSSNFNWPPLMSKTLWHFPNVQHLYVNKKILVYQFQAQDILVSNLTHFYSECPQSDLFWCELVKSAPRLLSICSDASPANILELKMLNPLLCFLPYQNIWGNSGSAEDISGFNKVSV